MAKTNGRNAATKIAEMLIDVLSDTYVLTVKTHGYHWNVTGTLFPQLHEFFGKQYEELFDAADDIAERIRALDLPAPGSMASFLSNTKIKEATGAPGNAAAMLRDLLKSHETLRARLAETADAAGEAGDKATEDLMVERLRAHDKIIWMLRSQAG
ncbi:MAG: DNA starvation/stationary phase protection protein [Alphaproteobacteria bacterium]|nr:DNA starvation/stationary phase protection protein [Alphaproteobacteria bacterium]